MSHPIDDLFKKGLGDSRYAYDEQAWQGARKVLGLKKRRKKRFLWVFGGASLVALGILVVLLSKNDVVSTIIQESKRTEDKIELPQGIDKVAERPIVTDKMAVSITNENGISKSQNLSSKERKTVVIGTTSAQAQNKEGTLKDDAKGTVNNKEASIEKVANLSLIHISEPTRPY